MTILNIAIEAKHLCRKEHSGVLSTHSTSMPGYPFGSVVPFFLTAQGDAIIYISNIALHTRNIKANDKVSLTIFDAEQDDSQSNGRVTIMGNAELFDNETIAAQYYRLFPQARKYQQTHDFYFYKIKTERVRFIGGFGKIHWINKEYWQVEAQDWHSDPSNMIDHMNKEHQDAMQAILQANFDVKAENITMSSVFPEGAHYLAADNSPVYVPFATPCETPTDVRKALVRLSQEARLFLSNTPP
ncbi:DUF2470 domain-containing protein [Alteromonas pelagimontana]|uniref:DUF2470 domain-containing protein n=1 Tax=Alteromonas pelagimontana TaxID=1858656 RepID=A0A6M4MBT1_9ALTE|nr:DUF2470 domain-containing protein [Alteromonas pelagimontana]QJR80651.1 DUF2470 domain-containing protein [Alteromonas pelagimontana]